MWKNCKKYNNNNNNNNNNNKKKKKKKKKKKNYGPIEDDLNRFSEKKLQCCSSFSKYLVDIKYPLGLNLIHLPTI